MHKLKIKKGTVVRTIMFAAVILNMVLKAAGKNPLPVDETAVTQFIELGINIAVLVVTFWKNNSFTENAIRADKYLEDLKKFDEGVE